MKLTSSSIHTVIHPTAAFSANVPKPSGSPSAEPESQSWLHSQLNPKNRIDSLEPPENPPLENRWVYRPRNAVFALPLFLGDHVPPLRFDVFLSQEAGSCQQIRDLLDLDAAFHTKDAVRVQRLGISRHILRTLQAWTQSSQQGDSKHSLAEMYRNLPFGSRIIFENLEFDIRNIKITIAQTFHLEGQLLGLSKLSAQLGLPQDSLPEPIDIFKVRILGQLTESVCLVCMDDDDKVKVIATDAANGTEAKKEELWILKALTSGTKYLYTELRNLLQMPPHPHIISHPARLVTKQCQFGGKNAVVGFMIPYHSAGGLRDTLPLLRIHGQLALKDQLKWAIQLAQALVHISDQGQMYYPDLRLDNILLSQAGDIVMVDFEQRGLWCEFGAPEVNALEYVRILASNTLLEDNDPDLSIPEEITEKFTVLLTRELPDWEALEICENYNQRPEGYTSFNIAWLCLSKAEQEAAVVYMLGRVLWCIFEGQSGPDKAAFWQSYAREPDLQFPEMRYTPVELRGLVDECTRGRRDVLSSLVTRQGSRLVLLREKDTQESATDGEEKKEERILQVARDWWTTEVKAAEDFLQMRYEMRERGEWNENYFSRPSLRDVISRLEDFQRRSLS
ncbi:unnamed protein product [Sordaria macrospora k-hell]|uniref:WGS project CABT00000000 data, contig 2.12 n=1 Tax=Sordaria macrospora (strain ATCC MYA-333 / DSM 997 / K(L3346) / K-hell) TaxID=771870 RepID=F7VY05_SORMK|nr:uncharacterized protein SMAC_02970 [Sordaria macrospora k-hell]CCC10399.1 unnamed protein product [Sordaria macrospora k-hell]